MPDSSDDDEEVGYGKPPRRTRFKKGQSGNPAGRPKGTPNLATALDRALKQRVAVTENGHRRKLSKLEAMVLQMINKALSGDARARQQVLSVMHVLDDSPDSRPGAKRQELDASDNEVMVGLLERIRSSSRDGGGGTDPT